MKVLTIGTFDTPHMGHAAFLEKCKAYGEVIVGVNSDEFVEQYKGKPPLFTYEERARLVECLGYTVVENRSAGYGLIRTVLPDILAIGSDWAEKDYHKQIGMTQEQLDYLGIHLLYIPYTTGISTTEIKRRCSAS